MGWIFEMNYYQPVAVKYTIKVRVQPLKNSKGKSVWLVEEQQIATENDNMDNSYDRFKYNLGILL